MTNASGDYYRLYQRRLRESDPEKYRAQQRVKDAIYRARHPERIRAATKRYEESIPGYRNEKAARYMNAKKVRCPKWADIEAIRRFYADCPKGFHVDHVIPLRARLVSGLHVLCNLQYLPAIENIRKGNRVSL